MIEDQAKAWVKNKQNQQAVIGACLEGYNARAVRKVAFFMAGIPGAGKTEFVRNMQPVIDKDLVVIEHDRLVEYIEGYQPESYYHFRSAGNTLVTRLFNECLKNGYSFVFDGTLSHDNGFKNIEKSLHCGYEVIVVYIHQDVKSAWKLTQDRELVKKRSIEKQGFIHTCEAIGTSLRHIFQTFSEHEKFAMWIIKKNGAPGLENSQLTLFDHSENGGHREDVEQILDIEYNIEELQD